jgi:hypothetical protein
VGKVIFIDRKELDFQWWDAHVAASVNGVIYGISPVMDTLAGKGWGVLWDETNKAGLALAYRGPSFLPLKIGQALFCRYAGVFYLAESPEVPSYASFFSGLPSAILGKTFYFDWLGAPSPRWVLRKYQRMPLQFPPLLSEHHRRKLKKAMRYGLALADAEPSSVVDLFFSNKGAEISGLRVRARSKMLGLLETLEKLGLGNGYKVVDAGGEIHAVGFFALYGKRVTFLHGSVTALGKESGAMVWMMHAIMERYVHEADEMDFGGSNIAGVSRFYAGFGAKDCFYYAYAKE